MIDDNPKPDRTGVKQEQYVTSVEIDINDIRNKLFYTVKVGDRYIHLELNNNILKINNV